MAIVQSKYRDAAQMEANIDNATPYVGGNGNWWRWDVDAEAYVDTGTPARGPQGDKGNKGDKGDVGPPGAPGGVVSAFGRVGAVLAQSGDYTASQVTYTGIPGAVDVAGALSALQDNKAPAGYGLGTGAKNISDLDWLNVMAQNAGGWYCGTNVTNAPTTTAGGAGWYTFLLNPLYGGNDFQTSIAVSCYSGAAYVGNRYNGTWSGWRKIGTATLPGTWYIPQLQTGFSAHAVTKYGKNGAGMVELSGAVSKSSAIVASEVILTLPEGFRPTTEKVVPLICGAHAWATWGYLRPDGTLSLSGLVPSGYIPDTYLGFNVAYMAQ